MTWITALLSFLGSLFGALPKILETVREWQAAKAAAKDKAEKDERNRKAIEDARRSAPPPAYRNRSV